MSYSVREQLRTFADVHELMETVSSYPVSELFNSAEQQGLLNIGKTKFYDCLKVLGIEPLQVGRAKHLTSEQYKLVQDYLAGNVEVTTTSTAIAPSQPASVAVQPEWGELATRMLEKLQYKEPDKIEAVRSLGQRLELLMAIADFNKANPDRPRTLPTAELALLLDVPKTTINGRETYSRYGFLCTNLNFRNGRSEWKVE